MIGQALGSAITACFTAETLVQTPAGARPIGGLKVGDWVFARDEDFGSPTVHRKQIEELYRYEDRATLDVTVTAQSGAASTIRTTPEHPFAIDGAGWVPAADLTTGMKTIDMDGNLGTITALTDAPGLHTVHNFSVTDDHTYFVSELAVWVHNQSYGAGDVIEEEVSHTVEHFIEAGAEVIPLDDLFADEPYVSAGLAKATSTPGLPQLKIPARVLRTLSDNTDGVVSTELGQHAAVFEGVHLGLYSAAEGTANAILHLDQTVIGIGKLAYSSLPWAFDERAEISAGMRTALSNRKDVYTVAADNGDIEGIIRTAASDGTQVVGALAGTKGLGSVGKAGKVNTITSQGKANAAAGAALKRELMLDEIVDHSFYKHVIEQGEFGSLGIKTKTQFRQHVANVIDNPTQKSFAKNGKVYYMDNTTKTIVITNNPKGVSTAFRPDNWSTYLSKRVANNGKNMNTPKQ